MERNVSSQAVAVQLTNLSSGQFHQPNSGAVLTYFTGDGGAPALGSVNSGIASPRSYGLHYYTPPASETDFTHVAFTFVASGAVTVTVQGWTRNTSLQSGVDATIVAVASLHTRVGSLSALVGVVQNDVSSLHTRASSIQADVSSLQTRVSSVQADLTTIHTRVSSVDVRVSSLDTRVGSAATQVGSNFTGIGSLSANVASNGVSIASLHTRVSSIATQVGSVFSGVDSLLQNPPGSTTVTDITSAALARFFNRDSGLYYANATSGSVVAEITKNAGGASLTVTDIASAVGGMLSPGAHAAGTLARIIGDTGTSVTSISAQVNSATNNVANNATVISSLHTRVSSVATQVSSIFVRTDPLPSDPADESLIIAATDAIMTRLGVPQGVDLSADVRSIQTMTTSIYARVGAPVGISLAVDVSSIQVGVNSLLTTAGSLHTRVSSVDVRVATVDTRVTSLDIRVTSLDTRVASLDIRASSIQSDVSSLQTRTGSVQIDVASLQTIVSSLYARAGAPQGVSLAVDVASIQTGVRSLAALISGGRLLADVAAVNSDVNAATNLRRGALATVVGMTTGDSTTSTLSTANLSPAATVADQFISRTLVFDRDTLTPALRGQGAGINSMTAAGVFYISSLTTAPLSGNQFTIG